MEHVIHIGVQIDDDVVKDTIIKECVKEIKKDFLDDIKKKLTEVADLDDYKYTKRIVAIVKEATDDFIERYKEEFIELSVERIVERLSRSKVVKEITAEKLTNECGRDKLKEFLSELDEIEN